MTPPNFPIIGELKPGRAVLYYYLKQQPQLRRQLTDEYREDIPKLQNLIGRDLSHWLKT